MTARRRALGAGVTAGALLCALYAATAAPGVTFWDAGEFLAAFATLGVPHPPGTPLFVCLGRAWALALGVFGVGAAAAGALLSGACTAAAGGVTAALLARWTGSARAGVAAALCAGGMSTAWASATEAEVYAPALLLSLLAVVAADAAGRGGAMPNGSDGVRHDAARGGLQPRGPGSRRPLAAVYALALAVPLHLSALVVTPVVAWLAATQPATVPCRPRTGPRVEGQRPGVEWPRAVVVGLAALTAAGLGAGRAEIATVGAALLGLVAVRPWIRSDGASRRAQLATGHEALGALALTALAASGVLILLVRARHDPWLNQGAPSTWAALADVVARRQYAPAAPWPRQAPAWLQLANLFEWADWQVALGLAPGPEPSPYRTPLTLAFTALGVAGARWHWRRDRRGAAAWALLLACGTLGVAAYLNLKAGPSFGAGVLPDSAPHEARERDYFFTLGWWAWGAWAGLGAVVVARRLARLLARLVRGAPSRRRAGTALGLAAAALPCALNWPAVDRRREPDASAAGAYARALLQAAPPNAVLLVRADNDTYPLWAAQAVDGTRRDVTVVTLSLLPAAWYRAELARRHGLLPAPLVRAWAGEAATWRAIADGAAARRRPLATSLAVEPAVRGAAGGGWAHAGVLVTRVAGTPAPGALAPAPAWLAASASVALVDTAAVRRAAARVGPVDRRGDARLDYVVAWARRQLACPAAVLAAFEAPPAGGSVLALRVEGPCQAR